MSEILQFMYYDMRQPIGYVPLGMLIGVALLPIFWGCQKIIYRHQKADWKRILIWFCCTVYVYVLLNMVFFSREPGSRTGVNMQLFGTWGETAKRRRFVLENILLFFPYGLLFPVVLPFMKKGIWCVLTGCLCSVGIEWIQYMTQRGHCQLDDIVMNTAGAFLGWIFYKAFQWAGSRNIGKELKRG